MVLVTKIATILSKVELVNGYFNKIDLGYLQIVSEIMYMFITKYIFID